MNRRQYGKRKLCANRKGHANRNMAVMLILAIVFLVSGCVTRHGDTQTIRDIEFTVLERETAPEELNRLIGEKKTGAFRLTYADQGKLYIAEGYGAQPTTGYSVEVEELYETADAVYIHTTLLGPEQGEETKEIATYPYVVVQMEFIEKDVLFD